MNPLVRNHVTVTGRGPALVFGDGFGCDQTAWQRVAPRFEKTHSVVLFDSVGADASDRGAYDPARHATLDGYARDLEEVCDAIGLEAPVFVGHSAGSIIGLLAAAASPTRFDRMVLLAPSPRFVDDPPYVGGFSRADVEQLLDLMEANFMGWASAVAQMALTTEELARGLRERFCAADPRMLRELARTIFLGDHRAVLPRVETPCLVVQCARDALVPTRVGEYVAATLPHARYRVLDVPGHMPHMSHPDEVATLVEEFLAVDRAALVAS
jgi:sigma-B regulation protein RsbQ